MEPSDVESLFFRLVDMNIRWMANARMIGNIVYEVTHCLIDIMWIKERDDITCRLQVMGAIHAFINSELMFTPPHSTHVF